MNMLSAIMDWSEGASVFGTLSALSRPQEKMTSSGNEHDDESGHAGFM